MAEESSIDQAAALQQSKNIHVDNPGEPAEDNRDSLVSKMKAEDHDSTIHDDADSTQEFDSQTVKMMSTYNKKRLEQHEPPQPKFNKQ